MLMFLLLLLLLLVVLLRGVAFYSVTGDVCNAVYSKKSEMFNRHGYKHLAVF